MPAFDLLELFAFALPARAAAPTPRGLALALDFEPPGGGLEAEAALLPELVAAAAAPPGAGQRRRAEPGRCGARGAHGAGGLGLGAVCRQRARPPDALRHRARRCASGSASPNGRMRRHCRRLPSLPVAEAEARSRLADMLGPHAEQRPGQADYAGAAAAAFAPRETPRRSASGAGRGGHRNRQDAWLSRTRQPVGGEEPRRRLDQHLHPSPATPDRRRTRRICFPIPPSATNAWSSARVARTTCAC